MYLSKYLDQPEAEKPKAPEEQSTLGFLGDRLSRDAVKYGVLPVAGMMQIAGDVAGIDSMSKLGREGGEGAEMFLADREKAHASQKFQDINSIGSAGKWAGEQLTEFAPQAALMAVTGGIGGAAGKLGAGALIDSGIASGAQIAGKKAVQAATANLGRNLTLEEAGTLAANRLGTLGAQTANAAGSIGMETSTIYQGQEDGKKDTGKAALYGIAAGILDSAVPNYLMQKTGVTKLLPGLGSTAKEAAELTGSKVMTTGQRVKDVAKIAGEGLVAESGQEGVQTVLENIGSNKQVQSDEARKNGFWNTVTSKGIKAAVHPEAWDDIIESMAAGGLIGVAMGGGASAAGHTFDALAQRGKQPSAVTTENQQQPVLDQSDLQNQPGVPAGQKAGAIDTPPAVAPAVPAGIDPAEARWALDRLNELRNARELDHEDNQELIYLQGVENDLKAAVTSVPTDDIPAFGSQAPTVARDSAPVIAGSTPVTSEAAPVVPVSNGPLGGALAAGGIGHQQQQAPADTAWQNHPVDDLLRNKLVEWGKTAGTDEESNRTRTAIADNWNNPAALWQISGIDRNQAIVDHKVRNPQATAGTGVADLLQNHGQPSVVPDNQYSQFASNPFANAPRQNMIAGPGAAELLGSMQQEGGGSNGQKGRRQEVLDQTGAVTTAPTVATAPVSAIDQAAHAAASSPVNNLTDPTEAQIEAGNYKKGHIKLHGLDISIENPAGSTRKGVDQDGKAWETNLEHHYGYIKGTVGKDKDHVDVFIKPGTGETTAGDKIFVIDQKTPDTDSKRGGFDEHKVMIGFDSYIEASKAYQANYDSSGFSRIAAVSGPSVDTFKDWLKNGDTTKPFAGTPWATQHEYRAPVDSAAPTPASIRDAAKADTHRKFLKRMLNNAKTDKAREAARQALAKFEAKNKPVADDYVTRFKDKMAQAKADGHDINDNGVYQNAERLKVPYAKGIKRKDSLTVVQGADGKWRSGHDLSRTTGDYEGSGSAPSVNDAAYVTREEALQVAVDHARKKINNNGQEAEALKQFEDYVKAIFPEKDQSKLQQGGEQFVPAESVAPQPLSKARLKHIAQLKQQMQAAKELKARKALQDRIAKMQERTGVVDEQSQVVQSQEQPQFKGAAEYPRHPAALVIDEEVRVNGKQLQKIADYYGSGEIHRLTERDRFESGKDQGNPEYGHKFAYQKEPVRGITSFAINADDDIISVKDEAASGTGILYAVRPDDLPGYGNGSFVVVRKSDNSLFVYANQGVDTSKATVILHGMALKSRAEEIIKAKEGEVHYVDNLTAEEMVDVIAALGFTEDFSESTGDVFGEIQEGNSEQVTPTPTLHPETKNRLKLAHEKFLAKQQAQRGDTLAKKFAAKFGNALSLAKAKLEANQTNRAQHVARKSVAESSIFTALVNSEEIGKIASLLAGKNDAAGFATQAEKIVAQHIQSLIDAAETPQAMLAYSELLVDGKPVLPEKFFESLRKDAAKAFKQNQKDKNRDPEVYRVRLELAMLAKGLVKAGDEEKQHFKEGFDHALKGKTKSTLPNTDTRYLDGYEAGQSWIATEAGKAWFEGKPQKKEKSTGDSLRRWFDRQKKDLDSIDAKDMKKAWERLLKVTARADHFQLQLAEDATPGAKTWMEKFRSYLPTFPEFFTLQAADSRFGKGKYNYKPQDVLTGRYENHSKGRYAEATREKIDKFKLQLTEDGSLPDDKALRLIDAERLDIAKQIAAEYQEKMQDLAGRFAGLKDMAGIKAVLQELYGDLSAESVKGSRYRMESEMKKSDEYKQNQLFYYGILNDIAGILPDFGAHGTWEYLAKREEDEASAKTRKDALVRPRLDKIVRTGLPDKRGGRDISAEEFKKAFGFADVTIGQWVTAQQSKDHLNYSYDAFMALADLLGAKPGQLSFGGKLHFAIGALGNGHYAATFHPEQPHNGGTVQAINVTNTRGDGAVLHEYFHAIDFMTPDPKLQRVIAGIKRMLVQSGKTPESVLENVQRFITGGWTYRGIGKKNGPIDNARYWLQNGFTRDSKLNTTYYKNALKLDGSKEKPYWANDKEMFARMAEAWGYDTLKGDGQRDDYLQSDWAEDGKVTDARYKGTPYPLGKEREDLVKLFSQLIDAMEWTDQGPVLKQDHRWQTVDPYIEAGAPFEAARKEALANLDTIAAGMVREEAEKKEELERKRREAAFGITEEKQLDEPPSEVVPSKDPAVGVSVDELEALFDDAVAELQAEAQEPAVDPAGQKLFEHQTEVEKTEATPDITKQIQNAKRRLREAKTSEKKAEIEKEIRQLRRKAGGELDAEANAEKAQREQQDKTAAALAKEMAVYGVKGIDEALKGLVSIFGGGQGKLMSFPAGFDEESYKKAKPHFEAAAKAFQQAGQSFTEFVKTFFKAIIQTFGPGVKPYAVQFAKEYEAIYNQQAAEQPETEPVAIPADQAPGSKLADWVRHSIEAGVHINWQGLFAAADKFHNGTQADGTYSVKDAYDALELGINRYLLEGGSMKDGAVTGNIIKARDAMNILQKLLDLVPTQTKRTSEMEEFQQFSTPPHFAFLANWTANLKSNDVYVEPSAGIGGLATFAKLAGVQEIVVNELSDRRLALLRTLPFDRFFNENAEQLDNILPDDVKPTVIVMNPPFSSTAGRVQGQRKSSNGAQHIEQALARLVPGGRLVAIVGEGMGHDKPAFRDWWNKIEQKYAVRANIGIDAASWAKYGTTFDNQILVIDKVAPDGKQIITGKVAHPFEALDLLREVRDERPTAETVAANSNLASGTGSGTVVQTGTSGPVTGNAPGTAGPAGVGSGGRSPAVQTGNGDSTGGTGGTSVSGGNGKTSQSGTTADQSGRPGAGGTTGRTGTTAAVTATNSTSGADLSPKLGTEVALQEVANSEQGAIGNSVFEQYTPKKVRIDGAIPHNTPLVESAALASVNPPDPTYTPNLPKEIITEGRLSDAQLEAVVYAGQAHQQFLGNGQRRGFFLGDGTGVGKGRQISGIIIDNMRQGQKKAVWISKKGPLIKDAQRDFSDLGGDPKQIFAQGKLKAGDEIKVESGILFTGYPTLRGQTKAARDAVKGGGFGFPTYTPGSKVFVSPLMGDPGKTQEEMERNPKYHYVIKSPARRDAQGNIVYKAQLVNGGSTVDVSHALSKLIDGKMTAGGAGKDSNGISYVRTQQIANWLGKDFDGVIVFDEAHEMGNAVAMRGKRGMTKPSEQALAALELQKALPKAKIVYVSATGATEVSNLAYAERLGLWGDGTPFSSVHQFVGAMSKSMSAMELVAQNLKQMGLYLARSLSFDGVTYNKVEHELTNYQRETYDLLAEGWQTVLQNINEALELTGVTNDGKAGGRNSGKIKGAIMSAFWGSHQRFFNQVITAGAMPSVLEQIERDLAENKSVVLQLVNTNEADQERALAKLAGKEIVEGEEDSIEELDLTPREQLINFIERAFPVVQMEQYADGYTDSGQPIIKVRPVVDASGNPVLNKQAVAERDKLIEHIRSIRIPDAAMQMLFNHFGSDQVAEITGRTQRVTYDENGKMKVEKRSPATVESDSDGFKDGKKRILIFSQAGGTGFSFHADRRYKNQEQRVHYILQPGWSADKAIQGLGRSHRTNQSSTPIYRLVTTDIPAQKRFISSIARRLEQLGALTSGQRDTAGGSLFSAADNLESVYSTRAVRQFFANAFGNSRRAGYDALPGDLLKQMGLEGIVDETTGQIPEDAVPQVTQFLNRLLSLRLDTQSSVFDLFLAELEQQIEAAKQMGSFDDGLQTINHVGATVNQEEEVYRDPLTGAPTRYLGIEYQTPNPFYDFDETNKFLQGRKKAIKEAAWFQNNHSKRITAIYLTNGTRTTKSGAIVPVYGLWNTGGNSYRTLAEIGPIKDKWTLVEDVEEARKLWEAENAKRPETVSNKLNMVVGGILPIWDRFNNDHIQVSRIATDDGRRFLGREIATRDLQETMQKLNVQSAEAKMTGAELASRIMAGDDVTMSNHWKLKRVTLSNDKRIEIMPHGYPNRSVEDMMTRAGVIFETIQYNQRYFVPTGAKAGQVIDSLMKSMNMNAVEVGGKVDITPDAVFARGASAGPAVKVSKSTLDSVVARISAVWSEADRKAVVLLDRFDQLPAKVIADAEKNGYDNNDPDDRIRGVAYKGLIYLVHENLYSVKEIEETLLHERLHVAVRSGGKSKLIGNMHSLLFKMGGGKGLLDLAGQAGFDFDPYRKQAARMNLDERSAFYVEEFLANVEGKRAYEKLPQKALRAIREFWGKFRAWLQDNGFTELAKYVGMNLDTYTQADLAYLLKGIQGISSDGTQTGDIRYLSAWHGSPHDHDKFSTDKIGTGEGAQAYGYGLYFAGNKEVAEWYRDKLTRGTNEDLAIHLFLSDQDAVATIKSTLETSGYKPTMSMVGSVMQEFLNGNRPSNNTIMMLGDNFGPVRDAIIKVANQPNLKGRLYKVELAPAEDEYLLWDKPLSEQSEKVKAALAGDKKVIEARSLHEFFDAGDKWWDGVGPTGQSAYRAAESVLDSDKAASEYLHSLGIRGIKYRDGNSRNKVGFTVTVTNSAGKKVSERTFPTREQAEAFGSVAQSSAKGIDYVVKDASNYNYVIFNDDDVTIEAKYSRSQSSPQDRQLANHLKKQSLGDKASSMVSSLFELAESVIPPKLKANLGKFLDNPWFGSEGNPLRRAIVGLNIERSHVRNELLHNLFTADPNAGYGGIELLDNIIKEMTPEEKKAWNALLKQGDTAEVRYADKELQAMGYSDKVIAAYQAAHAFVAETNRVRFEKLKEISLLPYKNESWFDELKGLLDYREQLDRGLEDDKQIKILTKLLSSMKKLERKDLESITNPTGKHVPGMVIDAYLSFIEKLNRTSEPGLVRMAYRHITEYSGEIDRMRNEWGQVQGYMPRDRKDGDWHVSVYRISEDEDGNPTRVKVYMKPTVTEFGAQKLVDKINADKAKYLKDNFYAGEEYQVEYGRNTATPGELLNDRGKELALENLVNSAFDKAGVFKTKDIDVAAMKRAVMEELGKEIMAQGFSRHGISREKHLIEGYRDEDYQAVLKEFASGMTGWLAKMQYAVEVTREADTFSQGNPDDKVWIHNYYKDSMKNSTYMDEVAATARSMGAVWYLGFKASSAVINAFQNYTVGQAELARLMKLSGKKGEAVFLLAKAQKDVLSNKNINTEEHQVLEQAIRQGTLHAQTIRTMTGLNEQGFGSKWKKFTEKAMTPFSWVEQHVNREPAMLAAYRIFKTTADGEFDLAAFKQAEDFVNSTHYVMGNENLPELVRMLGPIGKTAYLFQGYVHNYLLWLAKRGRNGEFEAIARSFGAIAVLGGVFALPGADDMDKWIEKWFGVSYKMKFKQFTKRNLHKYGTPGALLEGFINHGLPSTMGIDMSRAIAVNIPFVSDTDKSFGERVGGVWGGIAQKPGMALHALGSGDYYRAIESLMPEFVANPMRAARQYNQGATTLAGKPVFDETGHQVKYGAADVARKAFGFNPMQVSDRTELKSHERALNSFWKDKRDDVLAQVRKATTQADLHQAGAAAMKFNRDLNQSDAAGLIPIITADTLRKSRQYKPDKKKLVWERNQLAS